MFMPFYVRSVNNPPSLIIIDNINAYVMPIYTGGNRYSKSLRKINRIAITSTGTNYFYRNDDETLTLITKVNSNVSDLFKIIYSEENIVSDYLIPLGEGVLNGTYILPEKVDFPDFFVYDSLPIKKDETYQNNIICYAFKGYLYSVERYATGSAPDFPSGSYTLYAPLYSMSKDGDDKYLTYNAPSGYYTAANALKNTIYSPLNKSWSADYKNKLVFNNSKVPASVANWFNEVAILPSTNITIKHNLINLGQLNNLYEIKSVLFTTSSNNAFISVTDIFNTTSTLTIDYKPIDGFRLQGLSLNQKDVVIPVNGAEPTEISLKGDITLYEVWQTYRPPTTTFDINLYKNSAEPNKVDKTAELSTVGTISGVLRQECSLIDPEIIIQYDKPPDFNYCYIAKFGRYYYVENIVSMRQNLWRVRLRCDVLMTYKTQILNLTARIARQQYTYSYRQIDSEIPFTNDPEITVQDIPNNLNLGKPMQDNILLTVVDNGT